LERNWLPILSQELSLGYNAYRIRLKISSKGPGESGGARIISLVEAVLIGEINISEESTTVNLLTIYDKADTAAMSDKELKEFVRSFFDEK
jgi:hypothetical protein